MCDSTCRRSCGQMVCEWGSAAYVEKIALSERVGSTRRPLVADITMGQCLNIWPMSRATTIWNTLEWESATQSRTDWLSSGCLFVWALEGTLAPEDTAEDRERWDGSKNLQFSAPICHHWQSESFLKPAKSEKVKWILQPAKTLKAT